MNLFSVAETLLVEPFVRDPLKDELVIVEPKYEPDSHDNGLLEEEGVDDGDDGGDELVDREVEEEEVGGDENQEPLSNKAHPLIRYCVLATSLWLISDLVNYFDFK